MSTHSRTGQAISVESGKTSSTPLSTTDHSSEPTSTTHIPLPSSILPSSNAHSLPANSTIDVAAPAPQLSDQSTGPLMPAALARASTSGSTPQRTHTMVTRSHDGTLPTPPFVISRHPTSLFVQIYRNHSPSPRHVYTHAKSHARRV